MSTEPIAAGPNDVTVRAQFEHWMSDEGKSPDAIKRGRDGLYKYAPAVSAWITWMAAAKAEREACAKACEALWREEADAAANGTDKPKYHDAIDCAAAIRARSNS